MGIWLESSRLFRLHLLVIGLLVAAHTVVAGIRELTGHGNLLGLTGLFDLDVEANAPSLFSSIAMLGAGALFWLTGTAARRHGRAEANHWRGLAVVFALLAMDEAAGIHELISVPLRESLELGGAFHFAWVLPYAAFVLVLTAICARFLLSLDRVMWRALLAAAVTYLAGAIGMELVGGAIASAAQPDQVAYVAAVTCEETLEMLGVALLIRALVAYNERHFGLQARGGPAAELAGLPDATSREAWLTPQEALLILELRAQRGGEPAWGPLREGVRLGVSAPAPTPAKSATAQRSQA